MPRCLCRTLIERITQIFLSYRTGIFVRLEGFLTYPNKFTNSVHICLTPLVSSENIPRIDLVLYIIQTSIIAVGDDGVALCLEGFEVVLYPTAEECAALFQGRLIDDDLCTLCLDALHDTLDGRLAEVVAV